MARKRVLLLFVIITVLFSLGLPLVSAEVCVPSFIDTDGVSGSYSSLTHPQDGNCQPMHVLSDGDLNDQETREKYEATSCCCRCFGNDNYEVIGFEAPHDYEHLVSEKFCEEKGYSLGDDDHYPDCAKACNSTCSGKSGPLIEESDLYHVVSGHIYDNKTGNPIENISVFALDQGDDVIVEATTDADGFYNLSSVPGVQNGENKFLAITPSGHPLECVDAYKNKELAEDTQLDFNMQGCAENENFCQPDWNTSDWGECKPYFGEGFEGQYVQTRTVTDLNRCNVSSGKPESWRLCEGTANLSNCGNGELEQGEFCDPATQENAGSPVFRLANGETQSSVTCNDILGSGYSDTEVTCTDTCNFNYEDCQPVCGFQCDRKEECEMEECQSLCEGNPLCDDECEGQKPVFLPTNESDVDIFNTRNVFDLYDKDVLPPNHYPGIKYFDQTKDVELTWRFNGTCEDEILAYQIVYCEEEGNSGTCKGTTRQRVEVPKGQHRYKVENLLKPQSSFCYNVCAIGRDGSKECAYDENKQLPCFNTGEEYCMEEHPPGYNCEESDSGQIVPTGCTIREFEGYGGKTHRFTNHSYNVSDEDCTGKTCVETEYDPLNDKLGATCKDQINCSACNGMFGLYSSVPGKKVLYENQNGQERKASCDWFINPTQDQFSTNWGGLCYYDASRNSFNYFDECSKVDSCYDYKTAETCGNDPCNKMNSTCEWSSYSEELGVGVCKPADENEEECGRCDTDSPLGFCNEQLCENNYGNCYYKEPSENVIDTAEENVLVSLLDITFNDERYDKELVPTCVHEQDMACYLYQNEKDCVNNSGNATVDVTYEGRTPIYGTNELLNASQDRYGFNTCAWSTSNDDSYFNGCHKNADNKYNDSASWLGETRDDCFSTKYSSDLRCLQDVTPPNTSLILREASENPIYEGLPTYGVNELSNITFKVEDDTWAADEPTTYFTVLSKEKCPADCYDFTCEGVDKSSCINRAKQCKEQGCEVYPTQEREDLSKPDYKEEAIGNGVHKIKFFSTDPARNLEVIDSTEIFIDSTAPEIQFEEEEDLNITTFKLNEIYRSNVTIGFTTTEQAHCRYKMTYSSSSGNEMVYDQKRERINDTFEANFYYVPDNYYNFTISCVDEYKNEDTLSIPLWVEGDVSISKAQPQANVYNAEQIEDIMLSLKTVDEAHCRFDPEENTFEKARHEFLAYDQGVSHTRAFDEIAGEQSPSDLEGLYSYYTACNYTNRSVTEGLHSDMISFSIDVTGPETELHYLDDGDYVPFKETGNEATPRSSERLIKITCNDTNGELPGSTFGCKEIRYCYSDNSLLDINDFKPSEHCNEGKLKSTNGQDHFTDKLHYNKDAGKKIYFYGVDKGGNIGDVHRKNLKVIDTNFTRPTFTII